HIGPLQRHDPRLHAAQPDREHTRSAWRGRSGVGLSAQLRRPMTATWTNRSPNARQDNPTDAGGTAVNTPTYEKRITALLVVDPYNDFIPEGGKLWPLIKAVAEANDCVSNMQKVLNAARAAKLRVFYAMHHRYRAGDYETWTYIAPVQRSSWQHKSFEYGT